MADYVSALTGPEMDEALYDMASHTSEAWAVGTRNGEAVMNTDPTYNNNAKYWAGRSQTYNTNAQAAAARAEAAVDPGTAGAVFFDRAQSLTDAQKAQAKINIGAGGMSNKNLLDNAWFGNDVSVNQRGISSGTLPAATYCLDRWKFSYGTTPGTYNLAGAALTLTGNAGGAYCFQPLPTTLVNYINGKQVTASVKLSNSSIYSVTFTRTSGTAQNYTVTPGLQLRMSTGDAFVLWVGDGYTFNIRALKLEVGGVSTLVYDAPQNKAEELDKCLYYFERIKAISYNNSLAMGFGNGTDVYAPMMIHPKNGTTTMTYSGTVNIGKNTGSTAATNVLLYSINPTTGHITLRVTASNTSGDPYRVILNTGGYLDFSAEL